MISGWFGSPITPVNDKITKVTPVSCSNINCQTADNPECCGSLSGSPVSLTVNVGSNNSESYSAPVTSDISPGGDMLYTGYPYDYYQYPPLYLPEYYPIPDTPSGRINILKETDYAPSPRCFEIFYPEFP